MPQNRLTDPTRPHNDHVNIRSHSQSRRGMATIAHGRGDAAPFRPSKHAKGRLTKKKRKADGPVRHLPEPGPDWVERETITLPFGPPR